MPSSAGDGGCCGECGARLEDGRTCRDYLNDLLAREWDVPGGPGHRAHFELVASYNLQHPSRFTGVMLAGLRQTLADVLAGRATVGDARARARDALDGPTRAVKRPGDPPGPPDGWPTVWPMTVRDAWLASAPGHLETVRQWATSVDATLARYEFFQTKAVTSSS